MEGFRRWRSTSVQRGPTRPAKAGAGGSRSSSSTKEAELLLAPARALAAARGIALPLGGAADSQGYMGEVWVTLMGDEIRAIHGLFSGLGYAIFLFLRVWPGGVQLERNLDSSRAVSIEVSRNDFQSVHVRLQERVCEGGESCPGPGQLPGGMEEGEEALNIKPKGRTH